MADQKRYEAEDDFFNDFFGEEEVSLSSSMSKDNSSDYLRNETEHEDFALPDLGEEELEENYVPQGSTSVPIDEEEKDDDEDYNEELDELVNEGFDWSGDDEDTVPNAPITSRNNNLEKDKENLIDNFLASFENDEEGSFDEDKDEESDDEEDSNDGNEEWDWNNISLDDDPELDDEPVLDTSDKSHGATAWESTDTPSGDISFLAEHERDGSNNNSENLINKFLGKDDDEDYEETKNSINLNKDDDDDEIEEWDWDQDDDDEDENEEEEFIPEDGDPFGNASIGKKSKVNIQKENEEDLDDDEDDDEANPAKKSKKSGSSKAKKPFFLGLDFDYFKAAIAAEISGKDAPDKEAFNKAKFEKPEENEEDNDLEDEETEENSDGKKKKKGKKSFSMPNFNNLPKPILLLLKPISFLIGLYLKLANLFFLLINWILGLLAKIPILGKPFSLLLQLSKVLKTIATTIPLLIIIGLIAYSNTHTISKSSYISLPDEGGANFSQFEYNEKTRTATGVIKNTGNIIADVQPVFTIHGSTWSKPMSFARPKPIMNCTSKPVRVDIDNMKKVNAVCASVPEGMFLKINGDLNE